MPRAKCPRKEAPKTVWVRGEQSFVLVSDKLYEHVVQEVGNLFGTTLSWKTLKEVIFEDFHEGGDLCLLPEMDGFIAKLLLSEVKGNTVKVCLDLPIEVTNGQRIRILQAFLCRRKISFAGVDTKGYIIVEVHLPFVPIEAWFAGMDKEKPDSEREEFARKAYVHPDEVIRVS